MVLQDQLVLWVLLAQWVFLALMVLQVLPDLKAPLVLPDLLAQSTALLPVVISVALTLTPS